MAQWPKLVDGCNEAKWQGGFRSILLKNSEPLVKGAKTVRFRRNFEFQRARIELS